MKIPAFLRSIVGGFVLLFVICIYIGHFAMHMEPTILDVFSAVVLFACWMALRPVSVTVKIRVPGDGTRVDLEK